MGLVPICVTYLHTCECSCIVMQLCTFILGLPITKQGPAVINKDVMLVPSLRARSAYFKP